MSIRANNVGTPENNQEDWKLLSYVGVDVTGQPLYQVGPRPMAEINDYAYCKNAYPGVRWEIPIKGRGGAWTYNFRLMNSSFTAEGVEGVDYPTGMTMETSYTKAADGTRTLHAKYGRLIWLSPDVTTTVYVQIRDQDDNIINLTITITVDPSRWEFIDSSYGGTSTGSITQPWKAFKDAWGVDNDDNRSLNKLFIP